MSCPNCKNGYSQAQYCCDVNALKERVKLLEDGWTKQAMRDAALPPAWPHVNDLYWAIDGAGEINKWILHNEIVVGETVSFLGIYRKRETAEAVRDFVKWVMDSIRTSAPGTFHEAATTVLAALAKDAE